MGYTARKSERERESVIWKYMTYLPLVSKEGLRSKSDEVLFNDVWKWSDIAGLRDMPPKTHQKEKIFLFLFLLLLLLFSLRFEWETYKQPTERAARFFAIWFNHPHVDYDSLSLSKGEGTRNDGFFFRYIYTHWTWNAGWLDVLDMFIFPLLNGEGKKFPFYWYTQYSFPYSFHNFFVVQHSHSFLQDGRVKMKILRISNRSPALRLSGNSDDRGPRSAPISWKSWNEHSSDRNIRMSTQEKNWLKRLDWRKLEFRYFINILCT